MQKKKMCKKMNEEYVKEERRIKRIVKKVITVKKNGK